MPWTQQVNSNKDELVVWSRNILLAGSANLCNNAVLPLNKEFMKRMAQKYGTKEGRVSHMKLGVTHQCGSEKNGNKIGCVQWEWLNYRVL